MIKLICLLKRKEGMSKADFKNYYENVHSLKCIKLKASLGVATAYSRNYVVETFDDWGKGFDVVTQVCFNNMEEAQRLLEALQDPANDNIVQDEYNLFDRSAHRYVLVETSETDPSLLKKE